MKPNEQVDAALKVAGQLGIDHERVTATADSITATLRVTLRGSTEMERAAFLGLLRVAVPDAVCCEVGW